MGELVSFSPQLSQKFYLFREIRISTPVALLIEKRIGSSSFNSLEENPRFGPWSSFDLNISQTRWRTQFLLILPIGETVLRSVGKILEAIWEYTTKRTHEQNTWAADSRGIKHIFFASFSKRPYINLWKTNPYLIASNLRLFVSLYNYPFLTNKNILLFYALKYISM